MGANFVDLTDLSISRLRAMCREVDPWLDEGVYVQFPGPHYETPAEIGMVRAIGGHLAGMSTPSRRSPRARPAWRSSASAWSPTWPPA